MPPKKRTTKAKATAETKAVPVPAQSGPDAELPATETAEPPKDEAQPATGDLSAGASKGEKAEPKDEPDAALADADTKDEDAETEDAPDAGAKPLTKSKSKSKSKPAAANAVPSSRKRKQAAEPDSSSKSSRRTGRSSRPEVSQQQLLKYLLSKDAEQLLRPDDEKKALKDGGEGTRTYSSSVLNPFEELMCAMILARPISHVLGLRSIRTVLNKPYHFSNARTVKDVGEEKRLQALVDAKTQHKGKTADQLGQAANVILEKFTSDNDKDGSDLKKLLSDNQDDLDEALRTLKESINGLGDKGLDIFLRRVQWLPDWKQGYPYADGLSMDGLRNVGLTQDVDELVEAIEKHWSSLETDHLAGDNATMKKRRALVIVLERATGAHLENKIHAVQQAAAEA